MKKKKIIDIFNNPEQYGFEANRISDQPVEKPMPTREKISKYKIFDDSEETALNTQAKNYENKELLYESLVPATLRNSTLRNHSNKRTTVIGKSGPGKPTNVPSELRVEAAIDSVIGLNSKRRMMKDRLSLDKSVDLGNSLRGQGRQGRTAIDMPERHTPNTGSTLKNTHRRVLS